MLCLTFQHEIVEIKKDNTELRRSLNEAVDAWTDDRKMTGNPKIFTLCIILFVRVRDSTNHMRTDINRSGL